MVDWKFSYWRDSTALQTNLQLAFDEWTSRLLGGSSATGAGPDANGLSGGFPLSITRAAQNTTMWGGKTLAVVAYEGGPSVYTNGIDNAGNSRQKRSNGGGGSTRPSRADSPKALVTTFVVEMNRMPRIATIYRAHLHMAFARGLAMHNAFTDVGNWGKYGQWGHRETAWDLDSVKMQMLKDVSGEKTLD